jgi:putative Holliday junction resolvase
MRILALDLGEKRIGLAISDESHTLARGLGVYHRCSLSRDLAYLKDLVESEGIERIVLGLPVNMDGSLGPKAQETMEFQKRLSEELEIPVELFDERLTTAEAERVLLEAGLRRRKRAGLRDQLAAVLILQGYLDRRRGSPPM